MQLHNKEIFKELRRSLRNNATPAEKRLWMCLKDSQLDGRKFRRQHGFGKYVMDFYCPSERLCVELDGETHDSEDARAHDEERTDFLQKHFIRVIRFRNEEVYDNVDSVLERIRGMWRV